MRRTGDRTAGAHCFGVPATWDAKSGAKPLEHYCHSVLPWLRRRRVRQGERVVILPEAAVSWTNVPNCATKSPEQRSPGGCPSGQAQPNFTGLLLAP
jgi:hypothetical protein